MPGLEHSLGGHDLAYLRSVADAWRLDLLAVDARTAARQLAKEIPTLLAEPDELPAACRPALAQLAAAGGRLPWAQFVRSYGELREMGAARLEKEQPQRSPVSVTEQLWYRALVGRAFFDSVDGPLEFAFLPDEILALLPQTAAAMQLGRPARPGERSRELSADASILDEACSLLAAVRTGKPEQEAAQLESWRVPAGFLRALLAAAGLLTADGNVNGAAARKWLEMPRGTALLALVTAWLESTELNELRLLPGLVAEGGWQNEPKATRAKVLSFLRAVPAGQWWSMTALVADVKQRQPDFQRPSGDYESWYLRDVTGNYLRGFQHWEQVDGALLRFLLRGPLHWLGLLDLAGADGRQNADAFRWSKWCAGLLNGRAPALPAESEKLKVDSYGQITATRLAPRSVRYQVARFCDWAPPRKGAYQYQLSAAALAAAGQQGLRPRQLAALLKTHASGSLPPNLLRALKRWEQQGTQARLGRQVVLRVGSAAALKALRTSRAARWLGEPLGPLAVAVKPGAAKQVLAALLQLGYLSELEEGE